MDRYFSASFIKHGSKLKVALESIVEIMCMVIVFSEFIGDFFLSAFLCV